MGPSLDRRRASALRVLITGGAGFIGHHLVAALVGRGDDVTVLDDLATGDIDRLAHLRPAIAFTEGDIRDTALVTSLARDREVILHQAALPSVARSVEDPLRSTSVNVDGTVSVMVAAAEAKVPRVVFAGSSSVYGSGPDLPRRETQRPEPRSPYAAGKLAAEHLVHSLGVLHGIRTVVLRYFNVFGPGQDPNSQYAAVVPRFITAALDGERPVVHGDGTQSRDFTFIDNVVAANLAAAAPQAPTGLTCNIGCGSQFTLLELLAAIEDALGRDIDRTHTDARPGDVAHSLADIATAQSELGYRVVVPFDEGIRRTVAWYRQQRTDSTITT
jgi:UDP-glucose 4-epimerase